MHDMDLKLAREAAKMNGELKGLQRGRSEQAISRQDWSFKEAVGFAPRYGGLMGD